MIHSGRAIAACFLVLVTGLVSHQAAAQEAPGLELQEELLLLVGDRERGRLVFGPCRACHSLDPAMGHQNGPNLHRIFGRVVGTQPGFNYYSPAFQAAGFVWTPQLMYVWLGNPMAMYPDSNMMSLGEPDPTRRADLIAYIKWASSVLDDH